MYNFLTKIRLVKLLNPLDSLNLLEKKIEEIVYRIEILKKENFEIQNLLKIEREKSLKLEKEILVLKQDRQNFEHIKGELKSRVEGLINKLTGSKTSMQAHPNEVNYSDNITMSTSSGMGSVSNQTSIKGMSDGINMMDDDTTEYDMHE